MSARAGEKAALSVLETMDTEQAYMGQALAKTLHQQQLSGADRSAAVAYAKLVVENRQAVDFALGQYTKLNKAGRTVRNILRLGAARILFGNGADAQAVHGSVELCKAVGKGAQSKFVNAVLRNVSRNKTQIPWPDEKADPLAFYSVRYSWPQFAVAEAFDLLGDGAKEFVSYTAPQPVVLRANPNKISREDLSVLFAEQGMQTAPAPADERALSVSNAQDLTGLAAYQDGLFSLQGQASMLAARQAFCKTGLVLDVCAAPGGKSCNIAEQCPGAEVHSFDLHAHRVSLIKAQAKRLGLSNITAAQHDATQPFSQYRNLADRVLVDAPCSGLGTANHRPDVKWNKKAEDVQSLSALQSQILPSAAKAVKPGGKLIYCTCTFTRQENEAVVAGFLQKNRDFRLCAPDLPKAFASAVTEDGFVRLWPQIHHTDGFFICTMEKQS